MENASQTRKEVILIYAGGPSLGGHPAITLLQGGLILSGAILLLPRAAGNPGSARQVYAFVAGIIGFLITLAIFLEIAG